jgi:hypothetical protein
MSTVDWSEPVTEAAFARSPTRFPARLPHDSLRMISQPVSIKIVWTASIVPIDDVEGPGSGRQSQYWMCVPAVNGISGHGGACNFRNFVLLFMWGVWCARV